MVGATVNGVEEERATAEGLKISEEEEEEGFRFFAARRLGAFIVCAVGTKMIAPYY